jgi:predicted DNA-binding transcriptional regulator YafY
MKNNKLSFFKNLKSKFDCLFCRRYYIVYKNSNGKIKTYQVGDINLFNSFGNKSNNRDNVGFRAYCFGRKQVRSFRHDRIIAITKK